MKLKYCVRYPQVTHVSKISGRNVAPTRKRNKRSISATYCVKTSAILKWLPDSRYGNVPMTHSINTASIRSPTSATLVRVYQQCLVLIVNKQYSVLKHLLSVHLARFHIYFDDNCANEPSTIDTRREPLRSFQKLVFS